MLLIFFGGQNGRYLIAVSSGIAGLGAISVVMFLEMGYVAGFSLVAGTQPRNYHPDANYVWLGYLSFSITRCLTLAQFFEKDIAENSGFLQEL